MFKKLGPNSAQSSEGFTLERIGRGQIKYIEGPRFVIIEVEPGDDLAIYKSSLSGWVVKGELEYISKEDSERIIRNVCNALDFLKTPHVVF